MSDHDLTPAQEEAVREHLASARHTDPVPAHVAARLDDRLAELVDQRREQRAPVVTLSSRRRRLASAGLLAAAAAVVLGVALTQVVPSMDESDSSAGSSAGAADQESGASNGAFGAAEPDADAGAGAESNLDSLESQRSTEEKSPSMTTLDAATSLVSTAPLKPQLRAALLSGFTSSFSASPVCAVPGADPASQVPVTYDGESAVLVYGPTDSGRQRVDVHLCGEAVPERSVRLRTR